MEKVYKKNTEKFYLYTSKKTNTKRSNNYAHTDKIV